VYLADAQGRIRFHHFGEGEYEMTEMAIQQLLAEAGEANVPQDLVVVNPQGLEVSADWREVWSPESYTGYGQAVGFAQEGVAGFDQSHRYSMAPVDLNQWALDGSWTVTRLLARSNDAGGRLAFRFHARDVNLVMGPATRGQSIPFRVTLDGQALGNAVGTDVTADGRGTLVEQRTYQLVRQQGPIDERTFEIEFLEAGAEAYCFTFG
jgi:hypothetical protein